MTTVSRSVVARPLPRRPLVSWGALLAGLALTTALGWLLMLLGAALGVSVSDVTTFDPVDASFGIGAILWFIVSWLVAYFAGALLASRLAGARDDSTGVMHGIAVWSLGAIATVLLASVGARNAVQAAQGVANAGAATLQAVGSGIVDGTTTLVSNTAQAVDGATIELKGEIRRQAAELAAEADGEGGATQSEVNRAMKNIDTETAMNVAEHLIAGDVEEARKELTSSTDLDEGDVASIVEGLEEKVKNNPEIEAAAREVRDAYRSAKSEAAGAIAGVAGSEVRRSEVRRAIGDLSPSVLSDVAAALFTGDGERAKSVLAAETTLDEREIESIVEGVSDELGERIEAVRSDVEAAAETANDYAETALWTAFIAAAAALIAAIFGGKVGAHPEAGNVVVAVRESVSS